MSTRHRETWHAASAQTLLQTRIRVGSRSLPLSEFLRRCVDGELARLEHDTSDEHFAHARDAFLRAGLDALRVPRSSTRWIQFSLRLPKDGTPRGFYGTVRGAVEGLQSRNQLVNFFFMHKPPGVRLRFEASAEPLAPLADHIEAILGDWCARGLCAEFRRAVYEPEITVFGGPASMPFVHRLFTVDATTWLALHEHTEQDQGDPPWAVSLILLHQWFHALGIHDWEDIDVWDRVRLRTGRQLKEGTLSEHALSELAAEICRAWLKPELLVDECSPQTRKLVEAFAISSGEIIRDWRTNYLETAAAQIGPRQAAALLTIFHWNRAGLPFERQVLLAESLARRGTV